MYDGSNHTFKKIEHESWSWESWYNYLKFTFLIRKPKSNSDLCLFLWLKGKTRQSKAEKLRKPRLESLQESWLCFQKTKIMTKTRTIQGLAFLPNFFNRNSFAPFQREGHKFGSPNHIFKTFDLFMWLFFVLFSHSSSLYQVRN